MTIRQLKLFQVVGTYSSITKAANFIRVSQPTVSKEIRILEQELGAKLYTKVGHGIELTAEGVAFFTDIKTILLLIEELRRKHNHNDNQRPSTLSVAGTESPSAWLLPGALRSFQKIYPKVQTILRTGDSKQVERMILSGQAEVALTTNALYNPLIVLDALRTEQVLAVVAARGPLANKNKFKRGEISTVPLIAKVGGRITAQLEHQGLKPNVVMQSESIVAIRAAVKAGIGLGFLYRDVVQEELQQGILKSIAVPELKQFDIKCSLMYRRDLRMSKEAENFVALLRSWPQKSIRPAA
jgi:DNA-binding transcriptional LysR family regulator